MGAGRSSSEHPRASRTRRVFAVLAALLALATVSGAALWVLGGRLSAAVPRFIGPPPASLAGARDVAFRSASGTALRGWLAPGAPGRPCVVLAHGIRGDRRGMVGRAEFLQRAGYTVLLFDAQAHGESNGERITFGHLESQDAAAAVAYATSVCGDAPVGYIGVSLGGASALLGTQPLPVAALVLEAVYPTLAQAIGNRIAIRLGRIGRELAPLLSWQVAPRLGIPAESLAPLTRIADVRAPLLLIAGEIDRHTPLGESRALFAAAPEPKALWIVPGAAHVDFHAFDRNEYERRVLAFLGDALRVR